MENSTKLRLLYIYRYLVESTDKDNPISTPQLIKYLHDTYGITIGNDIVGLQH